MLSVFHYQFSGVGLVAVLCSILSTHLLSSANYTTASAHRKELFSSSLTSITHLGSAYSEQFRAVIGSSPALKSAIEQAAILNQTNKAAEQKRIEEANKRKEQANKPAIQLKMNFGNFN